MDDHTLEKLGFDHIRTVLAGHCSCALGKELARQIRPATNVNQVRRWLDQVRELSAAAETIGLPPMAGIYDLHDHFCTKRPRQPASKPRTSLRSPKLWPLPAHSAVGSNS